jgi:dTDP-4-amino-4,6-dideoxygalactose transaminase
MVIIEHRASIILYNLLKSLNNDKVFIIPANVCPIVICTFLKAKRKFELVDISQDTLCLDEGIVSQKLKKSPEKYAGVIFVRTYGANMSFEDMFKRIKKLNSEIMLIDDRCLNIPQFELTGYSSADAILFSTGYSKYVDIGWGGFAFLNNNKLDYKKNQLPYNEGDLKVLNGRLKEAMAVNKKLQYSDNAWLGDTQAKIEFNIYKELVVSKLAEAHKTKKILNDIYFHMLPKWIQLKEDYQFWRFNILIDKKKELLGKIFEQNLFASSHYMPMINIFQEAQAINAACLYDKVINLFNDFHFNEEKAEKICKIINTHIQDRG